MDLVQCKASLPERMCLLKFHSCSLASGHEVATKHSEKKIEVTQDYWYLCAHAPALGQHLTFCDSPVVRFSPVSLARLVNIRIESFVVTEND